MNDATLHGKAVMVTGAGGSIGSAICRSVLAQRPRRLVLVSLTESGLYEISRELRRTAGDCELVGVLGSAGDRALMRPHLEGIDLLLHAGAHKHVPICEQNPLTAIENNTIATYHLAVEAEAAGVRRFVFISTDKAVVPSSVMGATKYVAERVLRELLQGARTEFAVVRFGNVLDSAGSVLPLWREQISRGGPLTITDPDCTRFFMTIGRAALLVLWVAQRKASIDRCLFISEMGAPRRMGDVAAELMQSMQRQVPIEVVGLRAGEKLHEELQHGGSVIATENPAVKQVLEPPRALFDAVVFARLWQAVADRDQGAARRLLWQLAENARA